MEAKTETAMRFIKRVNDQLHGAKIKDIQKNDKIFTAIGVNSNGDEFLVTMAIKSSFIQSLELGLSPTITVLDSTLWIKEEKYEAFISTDVYGDHVTDILMQIETL